MDAIFSYLVAALPSLFLALVAIPTVYLLLKRRHFVIRAFAALAVSALTFVCVWQCLGGFIFVSLQEERNQPFLKPPVSHFPGAWRMPPALIDYLRTKGISSSSGQLILSEDGTFEMTDIPNLWGPWDSSRPPTSGAGTWELARLPYGFGDWAIVLTFNVADPDTGNDRADFLVEGTSPPYRLFIPKGDLGDSLILERQ